MTTSGRTQFPKEWLVEFLTYFSQFGFFDRPNPTDKDIAYCEELINLKRGVHVFPTGLLDVTKLVGGNLLEQALLQNFCRHTWLDQDTIWFEDNEADFGKGDYWYIKTLIKWSRMSRGHFQPQCMSEIWLPLRTPYPEYPSDKDEPIEISYMLGDKRYVFELVEIGGWMDGRFIREVNKSMADTGYQFVQILLQDGSPDQMSFICCFTKEEVLKLKNERGWKFNEKAFHFV